MENDEIIRLFDAEMRLDPPSDRGVIHKLPGVTFFEASETMVHGGWVLYTNLTEAALDPTIRHVMAFFQQKGVSLEWKVYDHDQPPNLKPRLLEYGFVPEEREALAVLDLEEAPEVLLRPVPANVRRVTEDAAVDDVVSILETVWEEEREGTGKMLKTDLATMPNELSVFLALADGVAASSAWMYYYPGARWADFFGGSTLPQYRGRGLYTALVAARVQEARGRGVRFVTVDASPMSRPILEKLGFRVLLYSQPFVWTP